MDRKLGINVVLFLFQYSRLIETGRISNKYNNKMESPFLQYVEKGRYNPYFLLLVERCRLIQTKICVTGCRIKIRVFKKEIHGS